MSSSSWYRYAGKTVISGMILTALGGCVLGGTATRTEFQGAAAADEPRSVQVARAVMAAGGNAMDAATAMYFTLSVTFPSMATLGGGGVCMVRSSVKDEIRVLEFYAEEPAFLDPRAERPSASPANMRGFFALHERYGLMPWNEILRPAEDLARSGAGLSRALVSHLNLASGFIAEDQEVRRLFFDNGRREARVGDRVPQLDLAAVLAAVRQRGAGEFYAGSVGRRYVEGVAAASGSLTMEDLRNTRVRWRQPVSVRAGNREIWLAPPPAGAGIVATQIYLMLREGRDFNALSGSEQAHLFSEAAMRAFLDRRHWASPPGEGIVTDPVPVERLLSQGRIQALIADYSPSRHTPPDAIAPGAVSQLENPAGTAFSVVDISGNAVACSLTPNNPFGSGRIAMGTGIFAGAAPSVTKGGPISLSPLLVMDPEDREVVLVLAGAGGVATPTAVASVLARIEKPGTSLASAMSAGRFHHSGVPDVVYYENGRSSAGDVAALARLGYDAQAYPKEVGGNPARVNGIYCPEGLGDGPCEASHDPRGDGYSFGPVLVK